MCPLLQSIEASHEDYNCKKNAQCDHKAKEHFIVKIVSCKCGLDSHFVGHVMVDLFRDRFCYLLQPSCVIEHDEHIVVCLVLGKECSV